MIQLTVQDIQLISFKMAQEHLKLNEPIPDFTTRFPNKLESSLCVPFQKFGKKYLYKTFISKAAILFYLMIKNHPFQNGNKRVAFTTLLVFLDKNNKWIDADSMDFYKLTIWVAKSPSNEKQYVIYAIEGFITKHLKQLSSNRLKYKSTPEYKPIPASLHKNKI